MVAQLLIFIIIKSSVANGVKYILQIRFIGYIYKKNTGDPMNKKKKMKWINLSTIN